MLYPTVSSRRRGDVLRKFLFHLIREMFQVLGHALLAEPIGVEVDALNDDVHRLTITRAD